MPTTPPTLPLGYTKSHGIVLSPHVIAWLPAILLAVALISTFFPWVGTYLGGSPADSQGPWRATFGAINRNYALEKKIETPLVWLEKVQSNWELMLPFLFALIAAFALSWADRGVRAFDPRRSPPLAKIWVWRHAVIAGLAGFAFLAISLQVYRGFGLETAIRKVVEEEFAKKAEAAATAGKPSDPQTLEYEVDQELRKYNVERSIWLDLGVSSLFLAFVSMVFAIGLDRRGAKPPPQIVIQY